MTTDINSTSNTFSLLNNIQLTNGTHILYTYTSEDFYIKNVVSFIVTGLKLKHSLIIIDDDQNLKKIFTALENSGFTKSDLEDIIFLNSYDYYLTDDNFDTNRVKRKFTEAATPFIEKGRFIRAWANVVWKKKSCLAKLNNHEVECDIMLEKLRSFTVCAYNGLKLPSSIQLEILKSHQYLMTDTELCPSSLYTKNPENPVMYVEENIEETVSELKKYKREVERLDRLEIISQMAATISHEVRNPMTTVKGFLQLFKTKKEYKKDIGHLNLMVEELDRANSIISEFLLLGKNKPTELKKQSLNKIIESIAPLIQASAVETSKYVILELNDIPPLPLDDNEIRQVLLNMSKNGLEAMNSGGKLTINTYRDKGEVLLTIKDEGKGIPPDILENLGKPFITSKEHGTGLGLATCYNILERHNAKVDVKTSPSGTEFSIGFKVTV